MDCSMPGFLGACSNSRPSSWWCHPTISSSVFPFSSRLQSLPASGSFPVSQFFTSGAQSIEVSASASVLSMNMQNVFTFKIHVLSMFIKMVEIWVPLLSKRKIELNDSGDVYLPFKDDLPVLMLTNVRMSLKGEAKIFFLLYFFLFKKKFTVWRQWAS